MPAIADLVMEYASGVPMGAPGAIPRIVDHVRGHPTVRGVLRSLPGVFANPHLADLVLAYAEHRPSLAIAHLAYWSPNILIFAVKGGIAALRSGAPRSGPRPSQEERRADKLYFRRLSPKQKNVLKDQYNCLRSLATDAGKRLVEARPGLAHPHLAHDPHPAGRTATRERNRALRPASGTSESGSGAGSATAPAIRE